MFEISDKNLRIVKSILKKHVPNIEVRVFGSRVTGKVKPYSDLDLVLVSQGKIPSEILSQLKEVFQESNLPFRVDVLEWNAISENFKKIIEQNYVVLSGGS